jgi:hypothetical protein
MDLDQYSTGTDQGQKVLRGLKRSMSEICETVNDCWESDCRGTRDEKSPICTVYVNNQAVKRSDVCLDKISHCWFLGSYGYFAFLGRDTCDNYILGYVVSTYVEHYARIINMPRVEFDSLTSNPLESFSWDDVNPRWARSEKEAEDSLAAMILFSDDINWPTESSDDMRLLMGELSGHWVIPSLKIRLNYKGCETCRVQM